MSDDGFTLAVCAEMLFTDLRSSNGSPHPDLGFQWRSGTGPRKDIDALAATGATSPR